MGGSITFDTGALIALEGGRANVQRVLTTATANGVIIFVPQVVLAEWWRGGNSHCSTILAAVRVDPLTDIQAKLAGAALAAVGHVAAGQGAALTIDAIVATSAASRGDSIYTSDPKDLVLFKQQHFKTIGQILKA